MQDSWQPNGEIHDAVSIMVAGEHVFGPLPPTCKTCSDLASIHRPYTHIIMAPRGSVRHLARLIKDLDRETTIARTFCDRKFKVKSSAL